MSTIAVAFGFQKRLKDLPIALVGAASGLLTTIVGLRYSQGQNPVFLNYRQESEFFGWIALWTALTMVLLMLGIYGATWLVRQFYPLRIRTFEPSFLAVFGVMGLFIGYFMEIVILQILSEWELFELRLWILAVVASTLCIWFACSIKHPRASDQRVTVLRISFPVLLILSLYLLNYTGFPGITAPAIARQQWAASTFTNYDGIVSNIRSCKPVQQKIGSIQSVAPTQGRNVVSVEGGSGYRGEMTLEIVGESGSGIASFNTSMGNSMANKIQFTHQGKVETLSCF
jgi:hypothetical protein